MSAPIALFGGAFDPPHIGHQAVCLYLLAIKKVSQVWWVPSPVHAFGKQLADFEHRVEMCRLASRHFSPSAVEVSSVERDLPPPQCTVDTVSFLQKQWPKQQFVVAIGSDNLDEMHRWKDYKKLRTIVDFVVVPRRGARLEEGDLALLPEISSSEIRQRLAKGQQTSQVLDNKVALYIEANQLYKGNPKS